MLLYLLNIHIPAHCYSDRTWALHTLPLKTSCINF